VTDPPIDCTTIRRYGAGERERLDGEKEKDGGVYAQRNFPFFREDTSFVSIVVANNDDYNSIFRIEYNLHVIWEKRK